MRADIFYSDIAILAAGEYVNRFLLRATYIWVSWPLCEQVLICTDVVAEPAEVPPTKV